MTVAEQGMLEQRLVELVRANQPVSTTQLLTEHRDELDAIADDELRRIVWTLVDRGQLEYDLEWRLHAAGAPDDHGER